MTGYFLGADVGASKTRALIADSTGTALGFGEAGPGNHEIVGYDGLAGGLRAAVDQALAAARIPAGRLSAAGFGVAGYDWPSEREPTLTAVAALGLTAPVEVVNDTLIGLLAGSSEGWGVAVVAGTGCNCWGWDRSRRTGQATGMGTSMGEGAGASELVWYALCSVSRAWSRRGPATRLTQAFVEHCGARDASDLLEGLSLGRFRLGPEAGPLVFQAAAAGDLVARRAIRWAGRELGSLAVGVIRQLGFEALDFEVVLLGGLFDGGRLLVDPMRRAVRRVAPRARLVHLTAPPVVGAVLLAMDLAGLHSSSLRQTLLASVRHCTAPHP